MSSSLRALIAAQQGTKQEEDEHNENVSSASTKKNNNHKRQRRENEAEHDEYASSTPEPPSSNRSSRKRSRRDMTSSQTKEHERQPTNTVNPQALGAIYNRGFCFSTTLTAADLQSIHTTEPSTDSNVNLIRDTLLPKPKTVVFQPSSSQRRNTVVAARKHATPQEAKQLEVLQTARRQQAKEYQHRQLLLKQRHINYRLEADDVGGQPLLKLATRLEREKFSQRNNSTKTKKKEITPKPAQEQEQQAPEEKDGDDISLDSIEQSQQFLLTQLSQQSVESPTKRKEKDDDLLQEFQASKEDDYWNYGYTHPHAMNHKDDNNAQDHSFSYAKQWSRAYDYRHCHTPDNQKKHPPKQPQHHHLQVPLSDLNAWKHRPPPNAGCFFPSSSSTTTSSRDAKAWHHRQVQCAAKRSLMMPSSSTDTINEQQLRLIQSLLTMDKDGILLTVANGVYGMARERGDHLKFYLRHNWGKDAATVAEQLGLTFTSTTSSSSKYTYLSKALMQAKAPKQEQTGLYKKLLERYSKGGACGCEWTPNVEQALLDEEDDEQDPEEPRSTRPSSKRRTSATSKFLQPHVGYLHIAGTPPPIPFGHHPMPPIDCILGPVDRFATYRHDKYGIDPALVRLVLSSLLCRSTTTTTTDSDKKNSLRLLPEAFLQDVVIHHGGGNNVKMILLVMGDAAQQDVPLVQRHDAVQLLCSYYANYFDSNYNNVTTKTKTVEFEIPKDDDERTNQPPKEKKKKRNDDQDHDSLYSSSSSSSNHEQDDAVMKEEEDDDAFMKVQEKTKDTPDTVASAQEVARKLSTVLFEETSSSSKKSSKSIIVEENGLLRFAPFHLIAALTHLASTLPARAAEILSSGSTSTGTEQERTPFDVVRQCLEYLDHPEHQLLVEQRTQKDQVIVAELEYQIHTCAKRLEESCVQMDPIDPTYHMWHIAMLAASLLLCSGNEISNSARLYPSFKSQKVTTSRFFNEEDEDEEEPWHEIRNQLPKFQESRWKLAEAVRLLLVLTRHQQGARAYLAVRSFLEWKQVVALLIGPTSDSDDGGNLSAMEEHMQEVRSIHRLCALEYAKATTQSHHQCHSENDDTTTTGLQSMMLQQLEMDRFTKLNLLADALECNPMNPKTWHDLCALLGPLGVSVEEEEEGETTKKADEDHRASCRRCQQFVRDGYILLDHHSSATAPDQNENPPVKGMSMFSKRLEQWKHHLLAPPAEPIRKSPPIENKNNAGIIQNSRSMIRVIAATVERSMADVPPRVDQGDVSWDESHHNNMSLDEAFESLTSWLPSKSTKEEEDDDMGDDNDARPGQRYGPDGQVLVPSNMARLETYDQLLPTSAEERAANDDLLLEEDFEEGSLEPPSGLSGANAQYLQVVAYKILISCHSAGRVTRDLEVFLMVLVRECYQGGRVQHDCNELKILVWLASMGLNVPDILRNSSIVPELVSFKTKKARFGKLMEVAPIDEAQGGSVVEKCSSGEATSESGGLVIKEAPLSSEELQQVGVAESDQFQTGDPSGSGFSFEIAEI